MLDLLIVINCLFIKVVFNDRIIFIWIDIVLYNYLINMKLKCYKMLNVCSIVLLESFSV